MRIRWRAVEVKVKLSRYAMQAPSGRVVAPTHSALDGVSGQCHAQAAPYPRGKEPNTHWIGGWVGLKAGLNTDARKNFCPLPGIKLRSSSL
jgi:hypothetical protein